MGCASSNPLIDSGKFLMKSSKDSAANILEEGEHVIEETASIAKSSLLTGVEHVKDSITGGFEITQDKVHSTIGKFSHTIDDSQLEENESVAHIVNTEEQMINKIDDSTTVSETDTVLISESENNKNDIEDMTFNGIHNMSDEVESKCGIEVTELQIVDLDTLSQVDGNEPTENINHKEPTPPFTPLPEVEAKQEEALTSWEAKADAILELRMKSKSIEINVLEIEPEDYFEYKPEELINAEDTIETEESYETAKEKVETHVFGEIEPSTNQYNTVFVVTEH